MHFFPWTSQLGVVSKSKCKVLTVGFSSSKISGTASKCNHSLSKQKVRVTFLTSLGVQVLCMGLTAWITEPQYHHWVRLPETSGWSSGSDLGCCPAFLHVSDPLDTFPRILTQAPCRFLYLWGFAAASDLHILVRLSMSPLALPVLWVAVLFAWDRMWHFYAVGSG